MSRYFFSLSFVIVSASGRFLVFFPFLSWLCRYGKEEGKGGRGETDNVTPGLEGRVGKMYSVEEGGEICGAGGLTPLEIPQP
jgi:hypothetical protein